jgi:hypothetical protein
VAQQHARELARLEYELEDAERSHRDQQRRLQQELQQLQQQQRRHCTACLDKVRGLQGVETCYNATVHEARAHNALKKASELEKELQVRSSACSAAHCVSSDHAHYAYIHVTLLAYMCISSPCTTCLNEYTSSPHPSALYVPCIQIYLYPQYRRNLQPAPLTQHRDQYRCLYLTSHSY